MEPHRCDIITKRSRPPSAAHAPLNDDVLAWLLVDDDGSETELLNLLDAGKDSVAEPASAVGRVRFIENPYSSLLVFQSSSSYITINGNEESCGSSFSDLGTSVMASVDTNGLSVMGRKLLVGSEALGKCTVEERRSASASSGDATREEGPVFGDGSDGCYEFGCEWDDEVLARFLGEEGLFSENH